MKSFYEAIGILNKNKKEKEQISILLEIPFEMLEYYNNNHFYLICHSSFPLSAVSFWPEKTNPSIHVSAG